MTERMIKANNIDIWTENFGDPSHHTAKYPETPGSIRVSRLCLAHSPKS